MAARRAFLLTAAGILGAASGGPAASESRKPLEPLQILTRRGIEQFLVELVATPEELARGLMFRTELPERQGMLFDFGTEQPVFFWMRNTFIPLDMLFIGADGVIRHLHENAVPLSEEIIPSRYPVRAVLEINGGLARRLGIRAGDRVRHRIFPPA
ncbi:MAG: DUF192 domain-containing protein [Geminicoccaceae bacterium]|nr:DUF192 domain-containing protein [Geminicoccaceae bacterium]